MRRDDRCTAGPKSPSRVPGWDHPLHKAFMRAITHDKPSTADMTTLTDVFYRRISRNVEDGVSGTEDFNLLLRRLMTHFERGHTGEGCTRLHSFGVCTGMPCCDFSRNFGVIVSAVTGSERTLAPLVNVVLGVVRMALNEQFPSLMVALCPGSMATDPTPYASLDEMWRKFGYLPNNKAPAVNGNDFPSLPVLSSGVRSSAPAGPWPAGHVRGRGRMPSQTPSWQTGSSNNPIVMSVNDPTDPSTHHTSKCLPLEEHHYTELFAVCAPIETDDSPPWSALLSPSTRAAVLPENRRYWLNFHEDTYSFRNCRRPFINGSGCLNPELGQLGDEYAYKRWHARITSHRRDGTSSRAHTKKIAEIVQVKRGGSTRTKTR